MFDTRTLLARRRVVEPGYVGGPSFTERLNAPVQGMATDILKLALASLWEDRDKHPDAIPVITVHDDMRPAGGSGRKEETMYAAIRRYHTAPDSIDEVARRVNEEFVDMISDMPGFVAYFVLNAGQGEIGSVSVFEDQESAEESNSRAEEWVRQNLSDLLPTPPDFAAGEVVAYRAK